MQNPTRHKLENTVLAIIPKYHAIKYVCMCLCLMQHASNIKVNKSTYVKHSLITVRKFNSSKTYFYSNY